MSRERCLAELGFRGVEFRAAPPAPGIEAPIELDGTVRGVRFTRVYSDERAPPKLMDCRLAVALDDLAIVASDRNIAEIRYSSFHRPRGRSKSRGHGAGLAIDVNEFVRKDGVVLNVLSDYEGAGVGSCTCRIGAPQPKGAKAMELRDLVCALDAAASFNLLLTPHYDRRHRNHFHLEVRRNIPWFLTQ